MTSPAKVGVDCRRGRSLPTVGDPAHADHDLALSDERARSMPADEVKPWV